MNKRVMALVGAVAVVAVVAFAAFWYLRDDAPAEVSLDAAAANVEAGDAADDASADDELVDGDSADGDMPEDATDDDAPEGDSSDGDAAGPVVLAGTWTVDTETGDFDFQSATGSFVGFRVDEELGSGIGSVTAVGRTGAVTGGIEIDDAGTLVSAEFTADLTRLTTDRSQRDRAVQRSLKTTDFPTATFALTGPVALGDSGDALLQRAEEGIALDVPGELTVAGVTQPVTIAMESRLVGDTIVVVGSVELSLADYGVEAPTAPIVVSVSDTAVLEVQLLLVHN